MISIVVNDRPLHGAALVEHGRTLLPLRSVAQEIGASVSYDGRSRRVTIARDGKRIVIRPLIVAGRSYVPVRFVAEHLGARVDYDSARKTVRITDANLTGYHSLHDAPAATFPVAPPVPPPTTTQDAPAYAFPEFNFYTTSGSTYYPGQWMHFVLIAPPGGTATLRLCNLSTYTMTNGLNTNRYQADIAAPGGLTIPNCRVDVAYTTFGGQTVWVPVPFYIGLYTMPGSVAATPAPRKIKLPPIVKRPEATPTPAPPPTPKPTPKQPPVTPKPVRTREPIAPRRSPPPTQ